MREVLQDSAVDDLADAPQVGSCLVHLLYHPGHKLQIGLVVTGKVKGVDIAFLTMAINAPVALLKTHRIPGDLQVDHVTTGDLQTDAFRDGISSYQNA